MGNPQFAIWIPENIMSPGHFVHRSPDNIGGPQITPEQTFNAEELHERLQTLGPCIVHAVRP